MRADGELLRDLAAAEDLDRVAALREAGRAQALGRDLGAGVEARLEVGDVDRLACACGSARTASTSSCSGRAACASACGSGSGRPRSRACASRPSARRRPCGRGRRSCRCPSPRRGRAACAAWREPGFGRSEWRPISSGSRRAISSSPRLRRGARPVERAASCGVSVIVDSRPIRPSFSDASVSRCVGLAPLDERTCLQLHVSHSAGSSAGSCGRSLRRRRRLGSGGWRRRDGRSPCDRAASLPGRRRRLGLRRCLLRSRPSTCLTERPRSLATSSGRRRFSMPVHRRLDEVDRVLGADALREHVADPGELEHGADAAAGDHAGTGAGRAQDDVAGAEAADDPVRDRLAELGHPDRGSCARSRPPSGSPAGPRGPCRSRSRRRRSRRRRRPAR